MTFRLPDAPPFPGLRIAPKRTALILAAVIGVIAGALAYALLSRPGYSSDFFHYWSGSGTTLRGGNPYTDPPADPRNPGGEVSLYPLPALLLLAPVAFLPLALAGALFMGLSSALAAWGVARTGLERLPLFLSAPFLLSLSLGQWSPLLVAAALVPAVSAVIVAKPNLGLAVWLARPSWRTAVGAALLVAISLVIHPAWPREWLDSVSGREEKFIPLLRPGGFVLALSLVAWRRADGRLLAALSAVPQALFFYDQLLLWLIPRTLRQSMALSLWSFIAFLLWQNGLEPGDYYVREAVPFAQSIYFAALILLVWNWHRDRLRIRSPGTRARSADTPDVGLDQAQSIRPGVKSKAGPP